MTNLQNDPTLKKKCGTSLFFDKNRFIFCVPISQILLLCKKDEEIVYEHKYEEKFPNLVSVCVHEEYTFVLGTNYLAIRIPKFTLELCSIPNVSFSDFLIIGESIFILDSLNGVIYQYYLCLFGRGPLKIVKINTTLQNPQGICSYVDNTILVASRQTSHNTI